MNHQELKEQGFKFMSKSEMEDGDYYKWWKLQIRDISIMYTEEYDYEDDVVSSYWEVNDHTLKNPTKKDILTLIRILNN